MLDNCHSYRCHICLLSVGRALIEVITPSHIMHGKCWVWLLQVMVTRFCKFWNLLFNPYTVEHNLAICPMIILSGLLLAQTQRSIIMWRLKEKVLCVERSSWKVSLFWLLIRDAGLNFKSSWVRPTKWTFSHESMKLQRANLPTLEGERNGNINRYRGQYQRRACEILYWMNLLNPNAILSRWSMAWFSKSFKVSLLLVISSESYIPRWSQ